MKSEDISANIVSIGGIAMTLAEFQSILTVAVSYWSNSKHS